MPSINIVFQIKAFVYRLFFTGKRCNNWHINNPYFPLIALPANHELNAFEYFEVHFPALSCSIRSSTMKSADQLSFRMFANLRALRVIFSPHLTSLIPPHPIFIPLRFFRGTNTALD
jgi:hypothetical protein